MKRPRTTTLAAWGAAGSAAVLLGAGAISAGAATTVPSTTAAPAAGSSASESGTPKGPDHERKGGLRHALHGEFVTGTTGAYVTRVLQQGTVSAVSPTSISVASEDGFTQTYAVVAGTLVRVDGAAATISDITVGEKVHLGGTKAGDAVTAERIGAGDPPAREGKGDHDGPRRGDAPADAPAGAGTSTPSGSPTAS